MKKYKLESIGFEHSNCHEDYDGRFFGCEIFAARSKITPQQEYPSMRFKIFTDLDLENDFLEVRGVRFQYSSASIRFFLRKEDKDKLSDYYKKQCTFRKPVVEGRVGC